MSRRLRQRIKQPREWVGTGQKLFEVLATFPHRGHVWAFALLAVLSLGVGCASAEQTFIDGRIQDSCNEAWPVCGTVAGCLFGTQSYITGRFPGTAKFIVQLAEASDVSVEIFLTSTSSSGTETDLTFYESGCQGNVPVKVTGAEFTQEVQDQGSFSRDATLTEPGDHLVTVTSDAQAEYVLKLDVTSKRDQ